MDDRFNMLLYLIIGVIYFFLKRENGHSADQQPADDKHTERQESAPVASTDQSSAWASEARRVPVAKKPLLRDKIERKLLHPGPLRLTKERTKHPTDKKVDRVLRRYDGWKKAIVMGELIRPYH